MPHIYAAGDVIGFPALAATAMEQGRLASATCSASTPELRARALPLRHLHDSGNQHGRPKRAGTDASQSAYEVGIARYREIARGQFIADPAGLLKLLFHPDSHRLLGVHAIGTGATELIHIGQTVMAAGMAIDYFMETVFNYPTLAECYRVAALDGLNRLHYAAHTIMEPAPAQAA